jgi:NAD(P)-dependent dehydrogenase (short-subunit alcohol dehydrogenase family)
MLTKCLSSELKPFNISVISVHPGSVQTDMGGPNAPLTKAESVSSILKVLFKITPENSGQFFNWKGDNLPW